MTNESDEFLLQARGLYLRGLGYRVDLNIKSGARLGILGGPQAGKTTLLRTLARLTPPREGELFWQNVDVTRRWSWLRRPPLRVTLVPANPYTALTPRRTVKQTFTEIVRRADGLPDVLRQFGLPEATLEAPVQRLSGAARARLLLALALLRKPDVLLIDDLANAVTPEAWNMILRTAIERLHPTSALLVASRHPAALAQLDNWLALEAGNIVEYKTQKSDAAKAAVFTGLPTEIQKSKLPK